MINLTKYINGFVPIIHNADIPIKETFKKFSLKKKVQCRVRNFLDENYFIKYKKNCFL
jgi:hypothetical protein